MIRISKVAELAKSKFKRSTKLHGMKQSSKKFKLMPNCKLPWYRMLTKIKLKLKKLKSSTE